MKPSNQNKPHLIIMVGIPGAGKSFFANNFSETFKAPVVSTDRLRLDLFDKIDTTSEEEEIIDKAAVHLLDQLIKTHNTIIYDHKSDTIKDRDPIIRMAKKAGYDPLYIWVQTETAEAKRRALKKDDKRPAITSEQFDAKLKQFYPPNRSNNTVVISGKHTYAIQSKVVLKNLAQKTQDSTPQVIATVAVHPERRSILIN